MNSGTRLKEYLGLKGREKLTGADVHRAISGKRAATRKLAALARVNWKEAKER